MSVTLKDIAKAAGVSITTVSYVINGKGNISEDTRRRIKQVVRELGYKRRSPVRGDVVLLSSSTRIFTMAPALYQAAAELGFTLHPVSWDNTVSEAPSFDKGLRIAGVLIYGGIWPTSVLESISRQFPTIFLGAPLITTNTDAIWVDNSSALYNVTHRLLSEGHRTIGFINGPSISYTSSEKLIGFCRAIQDFGQKVDYTVLEADRFDPQAGREASAKLFDRLPHVTAVISGDVTITHGLLSEMTRRSLSCKDDVTVVSFEGDEQLQKLHPGIMVVSLPIMDIAREALALLVQRIQQPNLPQRRVLIRPHITVSDESCARKRESGP